MYLTKSEIAFLKAKGRNREQIKKLKALKVQQSKPTVSVRRLRTDIFGWENPEPILPYY